jgi:hypothetical protein
MFDSLSALAGYSQCKALCWASRCACCFILCLQGSLILRAAPALLAMDPGTLAVKVQRLELLAERHPLWAEVRPFVSLLAGVSHGAVACTQLLCAPAL